jgi:outer membrane receptor protein involved in Fe transport
MKTELRAWYKPQVELTFTANYNLFDKFVVKADLFYIDNQFAKTFITDSTSITGKKGIAKELKGIFDANLGIEYRYNKKLGFFLNFNNIANYRYYRWSNYPTQRFSFMGGLSYSF